MSGSEYHCYPITTVVVGLGLCKVCIGLSGNSIHTVIEQVHVWHASPAVGSWHECVCVYVCIGGPSAYRREGPTPRRGPKGEGPTSRRAPEGEGHYQFCNLSRLLIAICTLR